ncbi:MAG: hypothetical protein AB2L14_36390 [Candidatus Xenobiia bacterium LiM19]
MKSLNLNSKMGSGNEFFAISHLDFLTTVWETTPIFLVDPSLMDFLYPPEKLNDYDYDMLKKSLFPHKEEDNPENSDDIVRERPIERPAERPSENREPVDEKEIDREMDRIDGILNEARNKRVSPSTSIIGLGVYKRNVSVQTQNHILSTTGKTVDDRPSIFICPDRIDECVRRLEMMKQKQSRKGESGFDILFASVYLHELCHRYTDISNRRYSTWWGRIIEESFANAVAFSLIPDDKSSWRRALLKEAISNQPLPYRGYCYWLYQYSGLFLKGNKKNAYKDALALWTRNEPSDIYAEVGKEFDQFLAPLNDRLSYGALINSIRSFLPGFELDKYDSDFIEEMNNDWMRLYARNHSFFEYVLYHTKRESFRLAAHMSKRNIWKLLALQMLKEILR